MTAEKTVHIRMYKGLLGDCFLLRVKEREKTAHILIDCGALQRSKEALTRMRAIAEDIASVTGGDPKADPPTPGHIDLLILTHEHWDHLSGFSQAKEIFLDPARLKVDHLWLAWTEHPDDEQAIALRKRFKQAREVLQGLAAPAEARAGTAFAAAPENALVGLDAFLGPRQNEALAASGQLSTREIITAVRAHAGETRYLEPGAVVETPGPVPIRTYVLGPPRDEARLFKDLPSSGPTRETYFRGRRGPGFSGNYAANVAAVARRWPAAAEGGAPADSSPFSASFRGIAAAEARNPDATIPEVRWFYQRYFAERAPCRYENEKKRPRGHKCKTDQLCNAPQTHRRIDGDWLGAAGAMALKLDSDTNNTSLALAFELSGGDVLLFAADAQVGNWESWHEIRYPGGVTAADLLARTLVYKVGHHGSHNATLRAKGLELMSHPCLLAMLSTDEAFAEKQGRRGWHMPWADLNTALLAKTAGRLLRGDATKGRDPNGATLTRDESFLERVEEDPGGLWIEYRAGG
jgi:hypothetical protein